MQLFFKNINMIQKFTMELESQVDKIRCKHCSKSDQFLSHGFVYKKQVNGETLAVGKRIFCSNRYGRSGCGKTIRLYLDTIISDLQYSTTHLFIFISLLLTGVSIQKSYQVATKTVDPRNAYRWINRLWDKLIVFRGFIIGRTGDFFSSKFRTKRFQILLPTLLKIFKDLGDNPCSKFQGTYQVSFI